MRRIVVTGGSGGAGRYVIRDLLENGYDVLNLDRIKPVEDQSPFIEVDLTDYQSTYASLLGYDAIVHFGANPEPDIDFLTGADRFKNNTIATYNVFNAAAALNMKRIVWASSETVLGYPFEDVNPDYVPVDEAHQLMPQNSYALSKVVCEELARHMNRLYGIPIIALRFSNILYTGTDHPANYKAVPSYWKDLLSRKFNLWGYIDARDVAQSVRLSLEVDFSTADEFIIAAADTIMNLPNSELMRAVLPGVAIKEGTGEFESLLSIKKARKILGFNPLFSWRQFVK